VRRIVYSVAMSLDGYIAGPDHDYDWVMQDPDIDFDTFVARFDTLLMGRKSFEITGGSAGADHQPVVVSRTLRQADHPDVTIISDNLEDAVKELRAEPGKDIWLFGGGMLFRSLLDMGLVDAVEIAIVPMLLGDGIPMLESPAHRAALRLTKSTVYEKTGIVFLEYDVEKAAPA
jgi:dihydrofolate reductase